jgi:hypothetical protein
MAVTVAAILKGPQSKVQRANRHIDELISRSSPPDRTLYEIVNEYVPATVIHLNPTRHKLTYRPKEDIPETFAGIIGDVLGNIRAAFDHLTVGIVGNWRHRGQNRKSVLSRQRSQAGWALRSVSTMIELLVCGPLATAPKPEGAPWLPGLDPEEYRASRRVSSQFLVSVPSSLLTRRSSCRPPLVFHRVQFPRHRRGSPAGRGLPDRSISTGAGNFLMQPRPRPAQAADRTSQAPRMSHFAYGR